MGCQKILSFLFLMMLCFALIGVMFGSSFNLSISLTGCLLLCVIYELLHWGTRRITYRSMFKDTKDLGVLVWNNMKQATKDVSDAIKKKK